MVTKRDGISPAKAEARIEKIEQERADFHKYYTGETGKSRAYDLLIDTGVLGNRPKRLEIDFLDYLKLRK